ncbi:unnamed protein product [Brassicogethes aeneus]|uniref:Glucose-methanol-choline oxidoreductase N-terminal domain-containing protein n=1 Tax=Brassicogethes aeneus TaxID=1431903 RepID=A0A9P0B6W5_BRAAE|nr:unnamed protein product [Brassicogethes aeneus]
MFIVKFTYFMLILKYVSGQDLNEVIQDYKNKINKAFEDAKKYKFDTDAYKYKPNNSDEIKEFGDFDYIIIGGGTTGSVIANRLSETKNIRVLLLEAGGEPNVLTEIPIFCNEAPLTDANWGYYTTPQKAGCQGYINRACPAARGRGPGGTSLINNAIYSRANPKDFDRIANLTIPDWAYDNILKYFKKSENFTNINPIATVDLDFHGKNGLWNIETVDLQVMRNPKIDNFMKANLEYGLNNTDYSSDIEEGLSYIQVTKNHGKRADTGSAFLNPIANRSNLVVSLESFVIKIEIDTETKEATGVLFTKNGFLYRAKARSEIILSAGTYNSPQILQLSGIGRLSELNRLKIPVISNLRVGENLIDHPLFFIYITQNTTDPDLDLDTAIRNYLLDKGLFTSCGSDGVVFCSTNFDDYPDLEYIVQPNIKRPLPSLFSRFLKPTSQTSKDLKRSFSEGKSFKIAGVLLDPKSKGTIKLKSNSPYDYPLINPNLLTENEDLEKMYYLVNLVKNLTKTEAFRKIDAKVVTQNFKACNGHKKDSKKHWLCIIKQLTITIFHPMGTCAMGGSAESGAVVDGRLKVFGVKNLRVADASVFPFPVRAHLVANCVLIGEVVSDFIKKGF